MSTKGLSASETGDRLLIETIPPAFPQSIEQLGLQGGADPEPGLGRGSPWGDLLIRLGFLMAGASAAKEV